MEVSYYHTMAKWHRQISGASSQVPEFEFFSTSDVSHRCPISASPSLTTPALPPPAFPSLLGKKSSSP